jgi:hypothetical protein
MFGYTVYDLKVILSVESYLCLCSPTFEIQS